MSRDIRMVALALADSKGTATPDVRQIILSRTCSGNFQASFAAVASTGKPAGSHSIYSRATSSFLSVTAHTGIFPHAMVTRRSLPPPYATISGAAYTIISAIKNPLKTH
jgi:hypothetical protein